MSTMGCSEFIDQLESWMEGERHPDARERMCRVARRCRSFAADLDAIQAAAPTLSIADPEPPARVWSALRSQLVEEGLIRDSVRSRVAAWKRPGWLEPFHARATSGSGGRLSCPADCVWLSV